MTIKPLLSMIPHGTDGSDGLEPGIHLRWLFHYKMGFPTSGFRLYRRESDSAARVCLDFGKFDQRELHLPYKQVIASGQSIVVTSKSRTLRIEPVQVSTGKSVNTARVEKFLEFILPFPATKAQIYFISSSESTGRVVALLRDHVVLEKPLGKSPKPLKGKPQSRRMQSVTLSDVPFDTLRFSGPLFLARVCFWKCGDQGDHPWEIINGRCGFGLPNGIVYEEKMMAKAYRDVCDMDWEVARCRLGNRKACNFAGNNFEDLKHIIGQMNGDGNEWPVGWSLMQYRPEPDPCSGKPGPDLQISSYDLLLLQSPNPDMARILGLYWVDTEVLPNKSYDYMVEAAWPEDPEILWKLEHQISFDDMGSGNMFGSVIWKDGVALYGNNPLRMKWASSFARVGYGIAFNYPEATDVEIVFSLTQGGSQKPIREVQLFVSQLGLKAELAAYVSGKTEAVDIGILQSKEGLLAVHSEEPIERLRLRGKGIIIFRVHYDEEYLPHGMRHYVLCNVGIKKPLPLGVPTGLKVRCLRGGSVEETETCDLVEHRFSAGLTWDLPELGDLFRANMPISFLVRRLTPRGETVDVTAGSPITVVREQEDFAETLGYEPELESCIEGATVKGRQLFRDFVDESGRYGFQVAAVDIFGRRSDYCPVEYVDLTPPVPPPPSDVSAKYLDFSTYDVTADEFGDPNLTVEEKEWLRDNQTSGIVVRWRWTEQLQTRSPEARGFRVHLKLGWLNVLQGKIIATADVSAGYKLETNIQQAVTVNSLMGEWLRQDRMIYKVVANTQGPDPSITVEYMPAALGMTVDEARPRQGGFALPVSKPMEQGGAAVDYRDPQNWEGGVPLHEETIIDPTDEYYQVFIADPPFPDPPFVTTPGQYEQEKTRYSQIGVSTFSTEGEGSVSSPAAILAVDRRKPPPQAFQDSPGLKATPADYHGKSTFPLRWPKPLDPGVKYYVFRAMDETLFLVDWAQRPRTPLLPGASRSQQVCDELNALNGFDKDEGKDQAMACYRGLSNNALKVLAGLEGLDQAFAKLNDKPIAKSDPAYQDRDTNVPAPGVAPQPGDPNKLLFLDTTLDGRGGNRYFYRIRPIDEIGNMGPLGEATLPVEIPAVTPVVAPVITNISGGDRQITVKWGGNPGAGILGYLVFRTDQKSVVDMRNMELRKLSTGDTYSVAVTDQNKLEFEFADSEVVARTPYYYAIAAITAGEGGKKLLSRLSPIKSAQAYDLTPPDPPVWKELKWVLLSVGNGTEEPWPASGSIPPDMKPAIRLVWTSKFNDQQFELQSKIRNERGWKPINTTEAAYVRISSTDYLYYDSDVLPCNNYVYRIRAIAITGIPSLIYREIEVALP